MQFCNLTFRKYEICGDLYGGESRIKSNQVDSFVVRGELTDKLFVLII